MLHDNEPGGDLNVGEYVVRVQSVPPRLIYRAREVGRIPKSVTLHTEEVCLVTSRGDAEQIRAERNRVRQEAEESAAGRRLLSLVSDSNLDSEGYAQALYYKKTCPYEDFIHLDKWNRDLISNPHFIQRMTGIYQNLLTKDVAVSKSSYMRRIKGHVDGAHGAYLTGWLPRDAALAELTLITQMYVDVLDPELTEWRRQLGCYNMHGRCYTYRFSSMTMSKPRDECLRNSDPAGLRLQGRMVGWEGAPAVRELCG